MVAYMVLIWSLYGSSMAPLMFLEDYTRSILGYGRQYALISVKIIRQSSHTQPAATHCQIPQFLNNELC